jgi:Na+/H+ antiporter NhaD/arsenite permease-like protein
LRRDPVPYLLALAMASNVGSTATITGNPQNILIGSASRMPYADFAAALAPVAAVGLVLTVALVVLFHPREFLTRDRLVPAAPGRARTHRGLAWKSVAAAAAMTAGFFAGLSPAKVALAAGGLLLLTRSVKPEKVYRQIDGALLVMFSGLFVVVAGFERVLLTPDRIAAVGRLHLGDPWILGVATAALSNLASNVPAVLLLKPFVAALADPERAWLVVAMASTLAGNFTVLGSVANLIVVQQARARGVAIGFFTHFKVGAPLTVLTIVCGILLL